MEPGQLEERVEELLSCRGPLVLEGASPLERLRQQVAEAGFTLVDASRGAPACWAFADPQLRQVVLLIADREHDGRVLLGISGRDYERVPAATGQSPAWSRRPPPDTRGALSAERRFGRSLRRLARR